MPDPTVTWDVDTHTTTPIRSVKQTCREKQDAAIEDIRQMANYTSAQAADLMHELEALRARVAALEAKSAQTVPPPARCSGRWTNYHCALPADHGGPCEFAPESPPASTATENQTYSWKPGDAWSQYTAAMDGETVSVPAAETFDFWRCPNCGLTISDQMMKQGNTGMCPRCIEVAKREFVFVSGRPRDNLVTVPISGDVDYDSGRVSWRKQWDAHGWVKVTP